MTINCGSGRPFRPALSKPGKEEKCGMTWSGRTKDRHSDDSYLVFVKWLTTRTKEHNLKWDSQPNVLAAKLRSMVVEFKTFTNRLEWSVFTVHDADTELMHVSPLIFDKSPLAIALDSLFAAIIKSEQDSSLSKLWHRFMP